MSHGSSQRPAHYLAKAVELATANVRNNGGPFGAIVVTADGREFEGVNRVTANLDPTAHAEVTAIRNACQGMGDFDLSGATLYTSCEPCPMCLASSLWARIGHVTSPPTAMMRQMPASTMRFSTSILNPPATGG